MNNNNNNKMTEQLPDFKTLNNSQLYTKINNPAEFIKEFRVGDELMFCSPLSNNNIINSVLILEINDLYVKYTNSKQFKDQSYCSRHFESNPRIEELFPNMTYFKNMVPSRIFKVRGPSEEDIQNKKDNIREVNEFILEERLRPVNLDEVGISFVGEDYREGRTAFYKNTF
jgi:hypothetical protein